MTILETERLLLRNMLAEDAVPLAELWTNPEVTRHMGGPRDFERVRTNIMEEVETEQQQRFDLWTLVQRGDGRIVGHCGLLEKEVDGDGEIEICYIIDQPFWGIGYATEIAAALRDHAARAMGLRRLIALIDPANVASEVVAGKIGMRLERETVRPSGKTMRVYAWAKDGADISHR